MRLPVDATLLLGEGADPALVEVWREERLPVAEIDADLEALSTATIVVGGAGAAEKAALAAGLGFRTFLVGDAAPEGARAVTAAQAIEAARGARARERWKAARGSGG
jgi:hypothetical protein